IVFRAVNDTAGKVGIALEVRAVNVAGGDRVLYAGTATVSPDAAKTVARISPGKLDDGEFLFFSWSDGEGTRLGENDFFPKAYKYYDLPQPKISAKWSGGDSAPVLTLTTDKPALFVTATVDVPG